MSRSSVAGWSNNAGRPNRLSWPRSIARWCVALPRHRCAGLQPSAFSSSTVHGARHRACSVGSESSWDLRGCACMTLPPVAFALPTLSSIPSSSPVIILALIIAGCVVRIRTRATVLRRILVPLTVAGRPQTHVAGLSSHVLFRLARGLFLLLDSLLPLSCHNGLFESVFLLLCLALLSLLLLALPALLFFPLLLLFTLLPPALLPCLLACLMLGSLFCSLFQPLLSELLSPLLLLPQLLRLGFFASLLERLFDLSLVCLEELSSTSLLSQTFLLPCLAFSIQPRVPLLLLNELVH
mmetsp:Transcript_18696/g.33495  ORF Transcript_18696/g.33495 Transcript_18696/m.33495 type:complete len:296 (-) Transcript_18696:1921-2808(-)